MTLRLAISGFGRIGRMTLRALREMQRNDMEVVLKKVKEVDGAGNARSESHVAHLESSLRKEAEVMKRIALAPHDNIAKYYGATTTRPSTTMAGDGGSEECVPVAPVQVVVG